MINFMPYLLAILLFSVAIISLCPLKVKLREFLLLNLFIWIPSLLVSYIYEYLAVIVILFGLYIFIYKKCGNKFISIYISLLSFLIGNISDSLIGCVMVYIFKNIEQSNARDFLNNNLFNMIIFQCIVTLLAFFIGKIAGHILNRESLGSYRDSFGLTNVLIIILLVSSIILFYIFLIGGERFGIRSAVATIAGIALPLYLLLIVVIVLYLSKVIEKDTQIIIQKNMLSDLQQYTESIEKLYNSVKGFRHDYINMLSTMSIFITENRYDDLEIYFNTKILPTGNKMSKDNFKLGLLGNIKILELKGVIAFKAIMAQENNIDFVIDIVEEVTYINMDIVNLSKTIGILLDNAIEESSFCDKPYINFCIVVKNESKIIIVSNKCRDNMPSIDAIYQSGFSTKGKNRGMGLATVKTIVDACENCFLETKVQNNEFTIRMDIYD